MEFRFSGDSYCGPTDARSSGNGSLMRLAPVVMFFYPDFDKVVHFAGQSSRTTHASSICIWCCRLMAEIIFNALSSIPKENVLHFCQPLEDLPADLERVVRADFMEKGAQEIKGDGYAVNSLEAALWSFLNTACLEEAILIAVNLGEDADTTAAICGQIAGAFYGAEQMPQSWLTELYDRKLVEEFALRLFWERPENQIDGHCSG